ncbi:PAS domain S-box protein [Aestuariicella hydrocarbonica]|uniref:PAS domain S-box protein n=1 Tax=Pseudomaricurvus hydrocarbonicus TaxID=1470433 RepID=A0A9E5MLI9_9GAMM|nr:PAS domain S-box protein [Aestuariicella hydrocarbonica]NHO63965.1 PAS domain S-box protein [Aestuariicella hydrocarbonica]
MSTTAYEPSVYTQLRDKAEEQLLMGTAPSTSHWSMGVDALRLLHRLSSNPESAEDALKLLHELQVHQVELDLQNEEIAINEMELVKTLSLYRELYDAAPLAYFLVDLVGNVILGNLSAINLFGVARDDLAGQRIDSFLLPPDRPQLLELLRRVAESRGQASCTVQLSGDGKTSGQVQFMASRSPSSAYVLLACCEQTCAA